jgi:glyceraldehyde 3-phosphate dehydrogenase
MMRFLLKRASLLRYDSIHGDFEGSVTADPENNALLLMEQRFI